MNSKAMRGVVMGVAISFGGLAALGPLGGCEGGGLGGLLGSKSAMEMLSPLVKEAADSYVGNLSSLTSSLGNIKDLSGVMDLVKKAEPMVKQLSSSYQTLSNTTGEERANLWKAFGPKIDSANQGFLGQAEKLKGNGTWGQMLGPVLEKVKLFQQG